jgi:hypothetical protein
MKSHGSIQAEIAEIRITVMRKPFFYTQSTAHETGFIYGSGKDTCIEYHSTIFKRLAKTAGTVIIIDSGLGGIPA